MDFVFKLCDAAAVAQYGWYPWENARHSLFLNSVWDVQRLCCLQGCNEVFMAWVEGQKVASADSVIWCWVCHQDGCG